MTKNTARHPHPHHAPFFFLSASLWYIYISLLLSLFSLCPLLSSPLCRASFASVESVKAASDVYIPVAGTVKEVNKKLGDDPSLVNKSAEGDAWFAKVTIANPKDLDSLLDDAAYKAFLKSEGH